MCLTIPAQIISINQFQAQVRHGRDNFEFTVNIAALPNAKVNDWVLTAADLAVQIVSQSEAEEIIKLHQHEK